MGELQKSDKLISNNKFRSLLQVIITVIVVWLLFWLLSGICFGILNFLIKSQNVKFKFGFDWLEYLYNPFYIFSVYDSWWGIFIKSLRHINPNKIVFIPFVAITGLLAAVIVLLARQEYAVRLWYVLNFRFAKIKDVKKMGLIRNTGLALGRFDGSILSAKISDSILCVGEMGSGKTSSVSIPSVLQTDEASIIAVDMTGKLPQYTAGYRSKIGEAVYFNWDIKDDPNNNLFYPRWNPLDAMFLPDNYEARDEYIRRIATYLVDIHTKEQESYWNLAVYEWVVTILGYWVAKITQAEANDYFLEKLKDEGQLTKEDKKVLLSYYIHMPKDLVKNAVELLASDELTFDAYVPIGSWGGVPEQWQGKNLCFAMITDWIEFSYGSSLRKEGEDWHQWTGSLFDESRVFAYGPRVIDGFNRVLQMSAQQRALIWSQAVKSFEIFKDDTIRERTNGNDIDFAVVRGFYDKNEAEWRPMTIYSLANTPNSKIVNRMFIDEILQYVMDKSMPFDDKPLVLVLDDVGHNLRLNNLMRILENGKNKNISVLLLCNSLSLVANTYSREELEKMINNTKYKIIKAPDNRHLSQQMDKLASFSTGLAMTGKTGNEAAYFHKLAKDFKLCNLFQINNKNYQIVLARDFYNRPIIADNIFFAEDEKFAKLSVYPANYTLPLQKVLQKTENDLITPEFVGVSE